jgi:hypothetical protein
MKSKLVLAVFLSLAITSQAIPMEFDKRRFGQEHTPKADATYEAVRDLSQGTGKEEQAGNLSGAMVRALLAKAPTCDQQDRADEIIDLAYEIGGVKKEKLIKVAKTYRQLERNTPKEGQPSELCKKSPRHQELDGLVQEQDPTGKSGGGESGGKGGDKGKGKDEPKQPEDPDKGKKNDHHHHDDDDYYEEYEVYIEVQIKKLRSTTEN